MKNKMKNVITLNLLGKKVKFSKNDVPERIRNIYSQDTKTPVDVYGIMCETREIKERVKLDLYENFEETLCVGDLDYFNEVDVEDLPNRNSGDIVIAIDDSDFYLSPNKQRTFVYDIIQHIKDWEVKSIRIFIFTTSILTLTDILNHNFVAFDEEGNVKRAEKECFASNYYTIAAEQCGLNESSKGPFATKFVHDMVKNPYQESDESLIQFIGDEIVCNYIRNRRTYEELSAEIERKEYVINLETDFPKDPVAVVNEVMDEFKNQDEPDN